MCNYFLENEQMSFRQFPGRSRHELHTTIASTLKEQLVNLLQRNEAQKPINDADSLLSNSTALQSGGQGRKQQVMAAGVGSGLDNCDCSGPSC